MPALPPYIPNPDADLAAWADNFSTLITATPAAYGLVAGDAAAIAAQVAAWDAAYALVTSPTTKTAATVQDKNAARVAMLATVRPYAQNIALNAGVTPMAKVSLGLNPRTSTPTPITTPTTYPVLSIPMAISLGLIVRFRDQMASPSVKSKPYGVTAMLLYATASATPIVDPTLLMLQGIQTKSPLTVLFPMSAAGLKAYLAARWTTRKGLLGPWSPIVSFTVPA